MIEFIKGSLAKIDPTALIIGVGGMGYYVHISLHSFYKIKDKDKAEVLVYIRQIIKEDSNKLYGFYEEEERSMFDKLISVSGVGPNTALVMLSHMSVMDLKLAIGRGDSAAIKKVKGIGGKTADRLILELKAKFEAEVSDMVVLEVNDNMEDVQMVADAVVALSTLGIDKKKSTNLLKGFKGEKVEDYVTWVLKNS